MHDVNVLVVSPEAADHGVAEFYAGGALVAYTILDEGDLMLRIEPRRDGTAVTVGARSLEEAIARAACLLGSC